MPPKKNKSKNLVRKPTKVEKLTPKEAILDYQIGNLRDLLSRLKFKRETLKNMLMEKLQTLNTLNLEGDKVLKETLIKASKFSTSDYATVSGDDVKKYLLETWKIRDLEENEVRKIQDEIKSTHNLTKDVVLELRQWQTYSDVTKKSNEIRIQMLETEYTNMKQHFESMVEYLTEEENRCYSNAQTTIECSSEHIRSSAIENAIDTLNKLFSQQMLQNKWLRTEKKSLDEKMELIMSEIGNLQCENIAAKENIFRVNLTHMLIPLSFCDIQVTDADDLHKSTILDLKLDQDMFGIKSQTALKNCENKTCQDRKHLNTINEKILSSICNPELKILHELNEDETSNQITEAESLAALGPLEKHACFLQGLPAKIGQQSNLCSAELQAQLKFNPELSNWPVNRDMFLKYLSDHK
ncbi:unnamed protein product [Schistosoma rodhaini]|uniref:Coiled-coil domain-containing protein 83 n=1 Tax=Schistosoma rodhaini TaxID=6188 RepID=A0A183QSJ8_9TREM|nr:unnamed protein product [Schistosoma rodhaini]